MGNMYELMCVGTTCSNFESGEDLFMPSIGTSLSKTCSKCNHCKNNYCELNLYDNIVSSIDEK
ncbi:hypothetical protein ACER0A_012265 [Haloimpatiens sp. FM7315]|uniref:hypothetical protein n=1 Tax=Haloimpatiens sp. FM7315 TaxID=3298609 RepID=UPI0035A3AE23